MLSTPTFQKGFDKLPITFDEAGQFDRINSVLFRPVIGISDVLQGLHLGSGPFIIFINYIFQSFEHFSSYLI